MPDINFPSSPSLNDTYTFNDIVYTWDGEKWTAYSTLVAGSANYSDNQVDIHLNQSNPTDGHVLSWTSGDYAWVAQSGGGGAGIALTDLSVTTASNSGSGSLAYNSGSGVFTFTPPDLSAYLTSETDNQTLSLAGNVISITNGGSVDLTSALGNVSGGGGSYGDSNVSAYLSAQGYATQATIVSAITDSAPGTLDTLNELAAALGDDPNFATTITNSIATKANTSSLANVATSGAYSDLSGTPTLATVATSGVFTDLTSRPTISLSGSDLTYDGTTLDLTGVGGSTTFSALTDTTIANLQTNQVAQWSGSAWVNGYMDMQHISDVDSADTLQDGDIIKYNAPNGQFEFHNLEQEVQGDVDDHLNVSGATSGQVLTWNGSDYAWTAKTVDTDTDTDAQTLSLVGNVITISGSSSNVDLTSALGNVSGGSSYGDSNVASYLSVNGYSNVDNDAQTLNLSANILTISGSNSSVDVGKTRFYYANQTDFPNATTYHGAIAHSHSDGAMYFAHGGSWNKLANDSTAVSSSSETTFTADVNFDTGVSEKFSSLTGATGVVTHDCDNGHIFYHSSISADFTANFTNLGLSTNYSTTLTLILNQGATAYIPSALQIGGSAQTINWQGGSAPIGTVNGIDAVSFTVLEVSGNYVVLGQLVDFT